MTDPLRHEIERKIKQIYKNMEKLGERYNDYNLMFCLENGNPIEPKLIQKLFSEWLKWNSIRRLYFTGLGIQLQYINWSWVMEILNQIKVFSQY